MNFYIRYKTCTSDMFYKHNKGKRNWNLCHLLCAGLDITLIGPSVTVKSLGLDTCKVLSFYHGIGFLAAREVEYVSYILTIVSNIFPSCIHTYSVVGEIVQKCT